MYPVHVMKILFRKWVGVVCASLAMLALALYLQMNGSSVVRATPGPSVPVQPVTSDVAFHHEVLARGLEHPWAMAMLPDRRILVTERPGRLRLVTREGLHPDPIAGLPDIAAIGQGGLLDVTLHPDYQRNGWIYLTYSAGSRLGAGTHLARARLQGHQLKDVQVLFRQDPLTMGGRHFGSRIVFDRAGFIYFTIGDRGDQDRAQQLDDHAGALIRLSADGRIPDDNPFVGQPGARPEIFSYGHRNPQGMTRHPVSGEIWLHEHGPQGGDEVNRIRKARNYGWPVITYGVNYGTGTRIGEGTHKPGMEQPVHYWVPSIAPSGMAFYRGNRFPDWDGDLLVGSLKFQLLARLEMEDGRIVSETRYLTRRFGRIRDVRTDAEGAVYLLTDADEGQLIRLTGLAN